MVTYLTQGTWIIKSTEVPTSSYDLDGKTEGTDYIRFTNVPKPGVAVQFDPGIIAVPGGTQFAVNLGSFTAQYTIKEVVQETRHDLIYKFVMAGGQPAASPYLYIVRVLANGSPPTLKTFYRTAAAGLPYMKCLITAFSDPYNEADLHYQITIVVEACSI